MKRNLVFEILCRNNGVEIVLPTFSAAAELTAGAAQVLDRVKCVPELEDALTINLCARIEMHDNLRVEYPTEDVVCPRVEIFSFPAFRVLMQSIGNLHWRHIMAPITRSRDWEVSRILNCIDNYVSISALQNKG